LREFWGNFKITQKNSGRAKTAEKNNRTREVMEKKSSKCIKNMFAQAVVQPKNYA